MKTLSKILLSGLTAAALLTVAGCATESNRAMPVEQVASAHVAYSGVRVPIAVGKFDNRSSYMRGIFSDGVDRLGGQAKTILITHLQQTNRFSRAGPRQHGRDLPGSQNQRHRAEAQGR